MKGVAIYGRKVSKFCREQVVTHAPRHADTAFLNDLQARELMDAPSVDYILLAARLRYAARLVKHCPPTLVAVLYFQSKGKQLPWTKQLCDDMRSLQVHGLDCPGGKPYRCCRLLARVARV